MEMDKEEYTHSGVGTKPFLPIPAAAIRSKLPASNEDDERRCFIFPLDFSEGLALGIESGVGETTGSVVVVGPPS